MKTQTRRVNGLFFNLLCISLAFFLILSRDIRFLTAPRIWAEEGTVYIQSFLKLPFYESLFSPHLGYYSFFNNYTAGISSALLPLNLVPWGTTLWSLLNALLCILAPLYLRSQYWDTKSKIILLIVFSIIVANCEIWLNSINLQFYFCLFTAYLVLSHEEKKMSRSSLLLIFWLSINAAFTGITSIILMPFLLVRFCKRSVQFKTNLTILSIYFFGALVQTLVLFNLYFSDHLSRFSISNLPNLLIGFFDTTLTFLDASSPIVKSCFLILIFISLILNPKLFKKFLLPLSIGLYLSLVFTFLSLNMTGGARYGYAPAVLFLLISLNLIDNLQAYFKWGILASLIVIFLFMLKNYFDTTSCYNSSWIPFSSHRIFQDSKGGQFLVAFPQREGLVWRIYLPELIK